MAKASDIRARWNDGQVTALAEVRENRDRAREAMRAALYGPRREIVSRRALDLMQAETLRADRIAALPDGLFPSLARVWSRDLHERIDAMRIVDALGLWTGPRTIGSLAISTDAPSQPSGVSGQLYAFKDGSLAAEAAAIAEREDQDDSGATIEHGCMRNLLDAGRERDSARVFAVVAGRILSGERRAEEAVGEARPDAAYALGTAAVSVGGEDRAEELVESALRDMHASFEHVRAHTFRDDIVRRASLDLHIAEAGQAHGIERLLARASSGLYRTDRALTDRLERLAEARDAGRASSRKVLARLLVRLRIDRKLRAEGDEDASVAVGRAAIGAAFGFASGWASGPQPHDGLFAVQAVHGHDGPSRTVMFILDGVEPLELPRATVDALAHLAAEDVPDRLRLSASDHTEDDSVRDACARLAEAVGEAARGLIMHRRSFGTLVGLAPDPIPHAHLAEGGRVWRAVPNGWPTFVRMEGKRPSVARPFADAKGRLVGYAAFDALSGEMHGQGRYAVYDLAGRRAGRLERDEGGFRTILSEPKGGFVSAPERISLSSK